MYDIINAAFVMFERRQAAFFVIALLFGFGFVAAAGRQVVINRLDLLRLAAGAVRFFIVIAFGFVEHSLLMCIVFFANVVVNVKTDCRDRHDNQQQQRNNICNNFFQTAFNQ